MAIYVTGDTHGTIDLAKLNTTNWPAQKELTKDDYLVILGDFGLIWDWRGETPGENYWLKWLNNKPFTTLFIDGNHENYDRLNSYPVSEWNGGKVQFIRPSIIHLMRGQYYNIDGATIWTMGGARSHDIRDGILDVNKDAEKIAAWKFDINKMYRIKNREWWEAEMPSTAEFADGLESLVNHDAKVDFIFTHDCPASTYALMGGWEKPDELKIYLEDVRATVDYKRWYFGHFHQDTAVTYDMICCYRSINRIW